MQEELDRLREEEDERVGELRTSLDARLAYLEDGDQSAFGDEDHLWAESLDVNVKKLAEDEREKLVKEVQKTFDDRHRRHRGLLRGRAHAPQGGLEALRQQGRAVRRPAGRGQRLAAGARTSTRPPRRTSSGPR